MRVGMKALDTLNLPEEPPSTEAFTDTNFNLVNDRIRKLEDRIVVLETFALKALQCIDSLSGNSVQVGTKYTKA